MEAFCFSSATAKQKKCLRLQHRSYEDLTNIVSSKDSQECASDHFELSVLDDLYDLQSEQHFGSLPNYGETQCISQMAVGNSEDNDDDQHAERMMSLKWIDKLKQTRLNKRVSNTSANAKEAEQTKQRMQHQKSEATKPMNQECCSSGDLVLKMKKISPQKASISQYAFFLIPSEAVKRDLAPPQIKAEKTTSMITDCSILHEPQKLKQTVHELPQLRDRSRSRSRNKLPLVLASEPSISAIKQESVQRPVERIRSRRFNMPEKEQRPDKYMLKKIFTPLKKILQSESLRERGIDLTEYFKARPNPKGGHRTPADVELLLWFVEEKYRSQPEIYATFLSYLSMHRSQLQEYGIRSYQGKQHWQEEYIHFVDFIFKAMKIEGNSEERYQMMFSHRPSQLSKQNLKKLKELFDPKSMTARVENELGK